MPFGRYSGTYRGRLRYATISSCVVPNFLGSGRGATLSTLAERKFDRLIEHHSADDGPASVPVASRAGRLRHLDGQTARLERLDHGVHDEQGALKQCGRNTDRETARVSDLDDAARLLPRGFRDRLLRVDHEIMRGGEVVRNDDPCGIGALVIDEFLDLGANIMLDPVGTPAGRGDLLLLSLPKWSESWSGGAAVRPPVWPSTRVRAMEPRAACRPSRGRRSRRRSPSRPRSRGAPTPSRRVRLDTFVGHRGAA